jgi:hypothetical protein
MSARDLPEYSEDNQRDMSDTQQLDVAFFYGDHISLNQWLLRGPLLYFQQTLLLRNSFVSRMQLENARYTINKAMNRERTRHSRWGWAKLFLLLIHMTLSLCFILIREAKLVSSELVIIAIGGGVIFWVILLGRNKAHDAMKKACEELSAQSLLVFKPMKITELSGSYYTIKVSLCSPPEYTV